jgi:hypothetical protein
MDQTSVPNLSNWLVHHALGSWTPTNQTWALGTLTLSKRYAGFSPPVFLNYTNTTNLLRDVTARPVQTDLNHPVLPLPLLFAGSDVRNQNKLLQLQRIHRLQAQAEAEPIEP